MASIWREFDILNVYEGEGTGEGEGEGQGEGGTGEGSGGGGDTKTYTKDDVEKLILKERQIHQDRARNTLKELEELRKSKGLGSEEKSNLEKQIEGLQNSLLTKEEQAEKEKNKLKTTYEEQVKELTESRNIWQNRYTDSTIESSLVKASVSAKAVNPTQILAILKPNSELADVLDESGKPTGAFETKVKVASEKDGKLVYLELTPAQAIERMKEDEAYANLFEDTLKGGAGMSGSASKDRASLADMSQEEYNERRKKYGPGAGLLQG